VLHSIAKLIIGALMVIGSAWTVLAYPEWGLVPAFVTVVKGIVPVTVFLLGLFIVWLELDELRIEKELSSEERKSARKKR
jgi:hypothetical protein